MRRRKFELSEPLPESRGGMRSHLGEQEGRPLTPLIWFPFLHKKLLHKVIVDDINDYRLQ